MELFLKINYNKFKHLILFTIPIFIILGVVKYFNGVNDTSGEGFNLIYVITGFNLFNFNKLDKFDKFVLTTKISRQNFVFMRYLAVDCYLFILLTFNFIYKYIFEINFNYFLQVYISLVYFLIFWIILMYEMKENDDFKWVKFGLISIIIIYSLVGYAYMPDVIPLSKEIVFLAVIVFVIFIRLITTKFAIKYFEDKSI